MSLARLPLRWRCCPRCAAPAATWCSSTPASGINASPGLASYSASKFALRGFADSLRADEPSLRVTSVHPGRIATPMQEDLVAYEGREYDASAFLSPATVAKVIADAVNAPPDAHIHEVVVRPR